MAEHLVVNMKQLPKPDVVEHSQPVAHAVLCGSAGNKSELVGPSSLSAPEDEKVVVVVESEDVDEEAPLIGIGECRICQEEDSVNNLETPCACSGSLKYAHHKCVQHWCNEKGDITCEICHQPYQSGYTAPARPPPDETSIDIGGVWRISGTPLDMHDPRLLAIAEAERQLFEADYDDYNSASNNGTTFCRSAALILIGLLLLRHALSITDDGDSEGDDDASTFFSVSIFAKTMHLCCNHTISISFLLQLFLLRAVSFLLPCYIMIWAVSILQRRRQRQAAALAAARFAIVVQAAQSRGLLVASAAPAIASQATPHLEHA
ncbi:uncharacterized protein LOC121755470 isoform X4 [Salvia splendens]|uniref:uncharacterized protein LOC121755470 isoform X4 n=1 Tax=Salvia splendens TaxID=180675 RepID=UPI001C26BC75|nr:uncharacterized protein LOC121755470 isoform X4 [Salvia splendens]